MAGRLCCGFGALLAAGLAAATLGAADWEAGLYIGGAHTHSSDLQIRQPTLSTDLRLSDVRYDGGSFEGPIYYGLRAGRRLGRRWAAEVEFIHLKVFADVSRPTLMRGTLAGAPLDVRQPLRAVVQRFSISHGVNLLLGNVAFRQPLGGSPRWNLVVRAGAGASIPHPESTLQGVSQEHYQWGSFCFQTGGGLEMKLWRGLWWTGEYKFTGTRQTVDIAQGTATTLLLSHHLVTGPSFRW